MTALFIIIFMDQLEKNKDHFPAVVGIVIAIICLIVFGSQLYVTFIDYFFNDFTC